MEFKAVGRANLADRHREELEEEVVVKRAVGALRVGEVGQLPALRLVKGAVHQRGRAFRGRLWAGGTGMGEAQVGRRREAAGGAVSR